MIMGYRALIIEDDHALADALGMRLSREGHKVTIAKHQREAYCLLDKENFDFVLLDLRLPADKNDMEPNSRVGFDTLDHIRDRFSQDALPVIVMTAYEETSQTAVRALKAFANDYITKPFEDSPESLDTKLSKITQLLESAKRPSDGGHQPAEKRHRIVFRKDCVEINGIKVNGRIHSLLMLLGSKTFMVTPAATNKGVTTMTGKEIARNLKVAEPTVRQYVTRFRKFIAEKHRKLNGGHIGKQEIIRNDRDWKGYAINFHAAYISRE